VEVKPLFRKTISAFLLLGITAVPLSLSAQRPGPPGNGPGYGPGNQRYVRHNEWRKSYHMRDDDWRRGYRVDYRRYHLRRPPAGYEWREVDGNYVMAAVATGIIASVIAASATR
jgi:Ni/Co efflux regulator RcnB